MRPATCSGRPPRRQGPRTRSNRLPLAPISDDGYNLGMPSVRLTIIVRLNQAASLDRLEEFVEVRRTLIGTDVFLLLSAADGPAPRNSSVTSEHRRFRLKPPRQSATSTTWSPA